MVLCISILYYWELLITVVVLPNFSLKYLYMFYCNTCVCVCVYHYMTLQYSYLFVGVSVRNIQAFLVLQSVFLKVWYANFFPFTDIPMYDRDYKSVKFCALGSWCNHWFLFFCLFVLLILALESVSYHVIHRRKANVYLLPFFHS